MWYICRLLKWQRMTVQFRARPLVGMDRYNYDSTDEEHTQIPQTPQFLFPPQRRSSPSSTASSTPVPSRSTSPLPELYPHQQSSDCPSDSDSEPSSPLVLHHRRAPWDRDSTPPWWSRSGHRRPQRRWHALRATKRSLRRLLRHPFFPGQPITIVRLPPTPSHASVLTRSPDLDSYSIFRLCNIPHPAPYLYSQPRQRTPAMACLLLRALTSAPLRPSRAP